MRTRSMAILTVVAAVAVTAQDSDWVRMWEDAQRQRPKTVSTRSRIATESENGIPMTIRGRVVLADGRTPAANATVFAYQTDANGVYNTASSRGWRLRGWARTDAEGRFEFRTIRPAPYPNRSIPAHVHLTIEGPSVPRQWLDELRFADDPLVTAAERERSNKAGAFGSIRPVTVRDGVQQVEFTFRLSNDGRF